MGIGWIHVPSIKGVCSSCGNTLEGYENEDYFAEWIIMDNGAEYCGSSCLGESIGNGTVYSVDGSLGINLDNSYRVSDKEE